MATLNCDIRGSISMRSSYDVLFAPEERDVYSLQRDTARALQRSAMEPMTVNISLLAERRCSRVPQGYKHFAPPKQRKVRQVY